MSDMKRLLGSWLSSPRDTSAPAPVAQQVLRLDLTPQDRWAPIPDDVAEWMGMNPYVGEQAQRAAS